MKIQNFTLFIFPILVSLSAFSQKPVLTQSADKVCIGDVVRLTAVGCGQTVVWSNGDKGSVITDTVRQTTAYNAVCMAGENIVFTYDITLNVTAFAKPQTPYLLCNQDEIKRGRFTKIKTFGCEGNVKWNDGTEDREIKVSPETTTTYTAICTNASGCSAEPISRTIIVYENKSDLVPDVTWKYGCNGENIVMKAEGCSGNYVWYKNTLILGKVSKTEEIKRGNSVEVAKGGGDIFYTARCQFADCLGNESNRLQLAFVDKIEPPTVTSVVIIDAKNPQAVNLSSVLGKPITSAGVFEFRKTPEISTALLANSSAITEAGTYYVVERSRLGKCVSSAVEIKVVRGDAAQGLAEITTNEPAVIATNEVAINAVNQSTDIGASISSVEPNADLDELGIPGGFSPNGDGVNDTFFIKNIGNEQPSLRVYNRFGHVVFDAEKYDNNWSGKPNTGVYKDTSLGIPDGTYYYVLRMEDGRQKISFLTVAR